MKRNIKYLVLGIFFSILSLGIISCSKESDKAVLRGKDLIEENQCEKALASLELALDEDPKNEEARDLKDMLENYLESTKALEEGKIREAEVKAENICNKSKEFPHFNHSVETLKKNIEDFSNFDKDINRDMEKVENLIKDKNYKEAVLLIKSLEGRIKTKAQEEELDQLKLKLISVLSVENEK